MFNRADQQSPSYKEKEGKVPILEIFSRDGDNGNSKTITGEILPKDSSTFNAIGATEELLSYIGYFSEYFLKLSLKKRVPV